MTRRRGGESFFPVSPLLRVPVSRGSQDLTKKRAEMNRSRNVLFQIILIAAMAALFYSCSTTNQDSPLSFVDASGNHPGGWIAAHGSYAEPDGSLCMDCHGDDLAGGITGVSCSSDAVGCHSGGPAFHPADWLDSSLTGNAWHGDAYTNGFLVNGINDCVDCHEPPALDDPAEGKCIICHFTLSGNKSPGGWAHASTLHSSFAGSPEESVCVACHEINISFGNQPSCHNCHDNPVAHEVEYLDHNTDVPDSGNFTSQCSTCHAISGTSPNASAPLCVSCHTESSPYSGANCTSCHGNPPNTGEHGEHSGETTCDECHQGAGSGSGLNHFYDEELDQDFITAITDMVFNGTSCSGTCHGKEHESENW